MEQFASAAEITKDESQSKVSVTFPSNTDLTTPLIVKVDLLDSSNAVLQSKNIGPETAESCWYCLIYSLANKLVLSCFYANQ